jgi:hypothetical protein
MATVFSQPAAIIVSESAYDDVPSSYNKKSDTCIVHYCDDVFTISRTPIECSLNQFRRDLAFESDCCAITTAEKIAHHVSCKQECAQMNAKLRAFFHKRKGATLIEVVEHFHVVTFNKIPKNLYKINVQCGKFARFDGNEKHLILSDGKNYFEVQWQGS